MSIAGVTVTRPCEGLVGREELEFRFDLVRALRHLDMKCVYLDRITPPGELLAPRAQHQPGEQFDLRFGRVITWQPFGIEQSHRPGTFDRDRLVHAEDVAIDIGRINSQADDARIGNVLWLRDWRWFGSGLGKRGHASIASRPTGGDG
ncbi:hypothetical protein U1739_18880 [Sphingomonas sp. PB4P5]